MATALTPTVFAKGGGDRGGGGHGGGGGGHAGGGGGAHFSAPAHVSGGGGAHFSAPSHASMAHAPAVRAQSAPRIVQQSAPRSFERTAPRIESRPNTNFSPSVARNARVRGGNPSVAFGGHTVTNDNAIVNNNAAVNERNARTFSANNARVTGRASGRDFRVPSETSREWDRGRVHEWNHHHFRWSGGDWVIIDPGFGYPYGYSDYDEVTPYSTTPYSYDSSGNLTMSAQDQLTRLGYSPGPIDGVMGGQTRDAIADFQNDNRLPVTGTLDTATLRALGL